MQHGLIPFSEVQKHNTKDDCWVVIEGRVYDLTEVSHCVGGYRFDLSPSIGVMPFFFTSRPSPNRPALSLPLEISRDRADTRPR